MKHEGNRKEARKREREMKIALTGTIASGSLSVFSEYYLQGNGLPAFENTIRVLYSVTRDPEWSYRITSTFLAHGGDVGIPIMTFFFLSIACSGAELLAIHGADYRGKKFKESEDLKLLRLIIPIGVALVASTMLFFGEFFAIGQESSQEHTKASGFDKFDLLAFSTVYIATFLYAFFLWARAQKKKK